MAGSQLKCLDDNHVNVKINDRKAEFYYCEDQRLALERLLTDGAADFNKLLNKQSVKEFISSKEAKKISKNWHKYEFEKKDTPKGKKEESEGSLTYWPAQSDTPIPELDLGWTDYVAYRGITRATVHMHPPKNDGPFIKEIVRGIIQQAWRMIALVMDDFTDRNIFEDLIDACYRRRLPVYIILDEGNLKYFLEMCRKMELNDLMIRHLRVRSIPGTGLYLTTGKVKGSLNQKFMIVDGEKVLSGSYSFTWSCSRLDRSTLTVFTGQILETFDTEFRELYGNSDKVNLHDQLNIKPGFQTKVTSDASSLIPFRSNELKRKFNNPMYLLVSEGIRRSSSDNNLAPADQGKVPESSLKIRGRRGSMKDSRKEDNSKGNQAVQEWLIKYDVRGLDEPEPLVDLIPMGEMPNHNKRFSGSFKFPLIGRNISKKLKAAPSADGDSHGSVGLGEGSSATRDPEDGAFRKSAKGKKKKSLDKSGKQPEEAGDRGEAGNPPDVNAGKGSNSFLERQISTTTTKSKKEKCVLS
ncbi:protein FAM83F-like [Heptranchias perlo]|uniref:protein FAM83F-like n=1 Tax=Heptranchias perlo TaxID=212740 RepID=UPI00355945F4